MHFIWWLSCPDRRIGIRNNLRLHDNFHITPIELHKTCLVACICLLTDVKPKMWQKTTKEKSVWENKRISFFSTNAARSWTFFWVVEWDGDGDIILWLSSSIHLVIVVCIKFHPIMTHVTCALLFLLRCYSTGNCIQRWKLDEYPPLVLFGTCVTSVPTLFLCVGCPERNHDDIRGTGTIWFVAFVFYIVRVCRQVVPAQCQEEDMRNADGLVWCGLWRKNV